MAAPCQPGPVMSWGTAGGMLSALAGVVALQLSLTEGLDVGNIALLLVRADTGDCPPSSLAVDLPVDPQALVRAGSLVDLQVGLG